MASSIADAITAALPAAFTRTTARWSAAIVSWTHPALPSRASALVHGDWPLMRLDAALAALLAYGLLIVLGLLKRACERPSPSPSPRTLPEPSPRAGESPRAAGVPRAQTNAEAAAAAWATVASLPRDPIKAVQIAYNVSQVALSAYMAVRMAYLGLAVRRYGFFCNAFDAGERDVAALVWLFYASKLYDFCDTVFIVVRSKWAQFSFLHLYHHASIFATYWWVTRTAYTGDVWMPVMTNALIHTIMYVYFLLTCFGVKPTWDRTLTLMQLVQFCIMITQGALNLAYGCAYPTVVSLFYVLYITFMLGLFTHFYILKYHRTMKPRGDAAFAPNKKAQ